MKTKNRSFRRFFIEQLELRRVLASDYLLEIEGIKGESSDAKHPEAIELTSFSWGASNAGRLAPADPSTAEEFRFVTDTSKASPQLYLSAAQGKHISKATLFVRKQGSDQHEYLKIKLTDILISSVQTRSLNEEIPKEEVTLNFTSIHQELTPTNPDGTLGEPITSSWTVNRKAQKEVLLRTLLNEQPSSNVDQTDAFLQLGGIKGESSDAKHKDWIQIESWSFGASNSTSSQGSGGGAGKVSMQDFHFVTRVGKASPLLFKAAANGESMKDATFTLRRESSAAEDDFLKVKFTDLLVSSYRTVGSTETETLEEVTLSFKGMTQSFSEQNANGGQSPPIVASLIAANGNAGNTGSENLLDKTVPAVQATDIFLKFDGIKGESSDLKHKDSIEILAYSWGVSQTGAAKGNGTGTGKVNVQDLSFTTRISKASPLLSLRAATGEHIKSAQLLVRKQGNEQKEFLSFDMQDTLISSYNVKGLDNTQPSESISLNFAKIEVKYTPAEVAGAPSSTPVKYKWTIPSNAKYVGNSVPQPAITNPPAAAAVDYFLKIEGVKGESSSDEHKETIEVNSFSWGVNQVGVVRPGSGLGAGKASFQDFHFVAPVSSASPQLFRKLSVKDQAIIKQKVTLMVRKAGETDDYVKFELADSQLKSIQTQSLNNSTPSEELSFNFTKMDIKYRSPDSSASSPPVITQSSIAVRPKDERVRGESILNETTAQPASHDLFLEIEGIKGESSNSNHKFDVSSFSFGASQTGAYGSGGGLGAGKVALQDFHFTIDSNGASPELLRAAASGKHIAKAELHIRKSGENSDLNYYKIQFKDLLVSSYSVIGSDETLPMEELSLNFTKIQTERSSVGDDGTVNVSSASIDTTGLPFVHDPGKSLIDQTTPSTAAADYFLKLDGIKGESASTDHKDWILLSSFSWGTSRSIEIAADGTKQPGKLAIEDFSFAIPYDKASPQLLSALTGKVPSSGALIDIVFGARQSPSVYQYKLADVIVSSYSLRANPPDEPTNNFRLKASDVDASFQTPPILTATANEFAVFGFDPDDDEEDAVLNSLDVDSHFSLVNDL
jgi:type VI secretion system Hcp family effector